MSDEAVRQAIEQVLARERYVLRRHFHPAVAAALERYLSDVLIWGMPSTASSAALVDALAPYGLADREGRADFQRQAARPVDDRAAHLDLVDSAYRLCRLDEVGVDLEQFRAEYAERARRDLRHLSPREVAEQIRRNPPPRRPSWPLRVRKRLARVLVPPDAENG